MNQSREIEPKDNPSLTRVITENIWGIFPFGRDFATSDPIAWDVHYVIPLKIFDEFETELKALDARINDVFNLLPLPTDPDKAANLNIALFDSNPIDHYFSMVREVLQKIFNSSLSNMEKAQQLAQFQENLQKGLAPSSELDTVKTNDGQMNVRGTFKIVDERLCKLAGERY